MILLEIAIRRKREISRWTQVLQVPRVHPVLAVVAGGQVVEDPCLLKQKVQRLPIHRMQQNKKINRILQSQRINLMAGLLGVVKEEPMRRGAGRGRGWGFLG